MAYIGQKPFQEFSSIPTKDSFTGDGSTTTFDLANDVVRGAENSLEVFIDNVRQEPGSGKAFTLGIDGSSNYRRITFSSAPANGASIYVINDKTNLTTIAPVQTDFNGVEIVLDADSDTTLHAETDDQVDLRIAGVDVLKFLQSSGDAVLKPMVDAKDIIFQQFDGNKIFEINDGNFVGVGGNATAPGEIRIFEDSDNGTNYSGFKAAASTTSSVAYQLPAADGSSGTQLTTDGSGVLSWSAAGVTLANDANNRIVTATGSGLNGESGLTYDGSTLALTGAATVSSTLAVSGVTTSNAGVVVDNITIDGTEIDLSSGDLTIDVAGDIILDADGADVLLKDAGTTYGTLTNGSGNLIIKSNTTTAATFTNANVAFAGTLSATAITGSGVLSTTDSTEATSTTSASLKTAGGLGVVKDIVAGDDIKLLSDSSVIHFGLDSEVTLTHNADNGLILKHNNVNDNKPVSLVLQTGETDIAANEALGSIIFQAPDEATGTDAILNAAEIIAVSEGDFSASSNATRLEFHLGVSEAASNKMSLSSAGLLTIADDLIIGDGKTIGSASDPDAITIASNGQLTLTQTLIGTALDISGDIDVDGTTNLDVVDIDGAVDIATTLGIGGVLTGTTAVFSSTSADDNFVITSTDADAGDPAPDLVLYRNSSSPADGDDIGRIEFRARNNNSQDIVPVTFSAFTAAVADGSETGNLAISTLIGGSQKNRMGLDPTETTFNDGSADLDFRVESNGNTHMIFVDAGSDHVNIGGAGDLGAMLNVHSSIAADGHFHIVSGTEIGRMTSSGNTMIYRSSVSDGDLSIQGNDGGSFITALGFDMSAAGAATFNNTVGATGYFIGNQVGDAVVSITKDGTDNIATFKGSNDGTTAQVSINNNFATGGSTDEVASLRFSVGNGGAVVQAFKVSDTMTGGARDVGLQFRTQTSNSEQLRFQIADDGTLTATDTSIGSLSDERLKKDIADLTYSIDTFKALKPRTFNWKNAAFHSNETNRRGFVAQELKTVDAYWVHEQKATKKSDDVLDEATYYEEGDSIPDGKSVGDVKTEATYTYKYAEGDGSDFDLLNDGSDLDNKELIAKLGKKDAMYVSVIQQLITRIEALEDA